MFRVFGLVGGLSMTLHVFLTLNGFDYWSLQLMAENL